MEIQSAFNAGVQGFQTAVDDASKAASNIVSNTVVDEQSVQAAEDTTEPKLETEAKPNLTQSVVDLKVAEYQAKGSAEVIKTADENLGTLLDVRV